MEQEHVIHWDKSDPTKLDLEYYETIGTFVKWIFRGGLYWWFCKGFYTAIIIYRNYGKSN